VKYYTRKKLKNPESHTDVLGVVKKYQLVQPIGNLPMFMKGNFSVMFSIRSVGTLVIEVLLNAMVTESTIPITITED
jgi:hypothetical protein